MDDEDQIRQRLESEVDHVDDEEPDDSDHDVNDLFQRSDSEFESDDSESNSGSDSDPTIRQKPKKSFSKKSFSKKPGQKKKRLKLIRRKKEMMTLILMRTGKGE